MLRGKGRAVDEWQMEHFSEKIERFAEVTREIVERAQTAARVDDNSPRIETEDELFVEIAASCKAAIRESGMSREQVLDRVNAYLRRSGGAVSPYKGQSAELRESKRPISIHVFNNFLSKPAECPMRSSVVHAICKATGNFAPYRLLVSDLGGRVVTNDELTYMELGRLQWLTQEFSKLKRQLTKRLCGADKACGGSDRLERQPGDSFFQKSVPRTPSKKL